MSKGERATITCPPDYAYGNNLIWWNSILSVFSIGSKGVGDGLIPGNSTLIFDVELLDFKWTIFKSQIIDI